MMMRQKMNESWIFLIFIKIQKGLEEAWMISDLKLELEVGVKV